MGGRGSPSRLVSGRADLAEALGDEDHRPMRDLLAYWGAHTADGAALRRADFHPEDVTGLLPHLFLADRIEGPPLDFRFRLVGTGIAGIEGEHTGRHLSELIPRSGHPDVWAHYERALAGELCLRRETLEWQGRAYIHYEVLLLPMTRAGPATDALLGMALYCVVEGRGASRPLPLGPMA
jgi:hypothetical protein